GAHRRYAGGHSATYGRAEAAIIRSRASCALTAPTAQTLRPVRVHRVHRPAEPILIKTFIARLQDVAVLCAGVIAPVRTAAVRVCESIFLRKSPRTVCAARFLH